MNIQENSSRFYSADKHQLPRGRVLIIGSGPAGIRAAKEILKRSPLADVTLMGNEPYQPYNRVQLSSLLANEVASNSINIDLPDSTIHPNFSFVIATARQVIHHSKQVIDADERTHEYDHLIIATGSRPHLPNIPGIHQTGVFTFRNYKDAEALYGRIARARKIVVVGGGLLGLEAAKALCKSGTHIIVVQQAERLMNRQLDNASAQRLQQQVEELGVQVIIQSGVREILGESRVTGVTLRDGTQIECDTVLMCAGIQPNKELALNSQISVAKGITVDNKLRTSADNVYAIGECCEHQGKVYGLVNPGYEQAAVVAENLCGGQSTYLGSPEVSRLKVVGTPVFSMGEVVDLIDRPRQGEYIYDNKNVGIYRKIVINKGNLYGTLSIGEWDHTRRLQEVFTQQRRIYFWHLLRFKFTGNLWGSAGDSVAQWPDSTVICQCNGIEKGTLLDAIATGNSTPTLLTRATGAGSVCGSCKPLLAELSGSDEIIEKEPASPSLIVVCLLAIMAAIAITFTPAMETSNSVITTGWFENIWSDKFWKQVTGFSLLGLSAIGLLISLRKRFKSFNLGHFAHWRLIHSLLGLCCLSLLIFHTGFHLGSNLNQALMINFLFVLLAGAIAGSTIAVSHKLKPKQSRQLRNIWTWTHILLTWPLPVLIATHIFTVYYF